MEPNFPSNGAPTLTVRGLNILHKFRRKQNTRTWRDKTDSQIVKSLESNFPIPIEIDQNAKQDEPPLEFLAQRSQYDIDFIFTRARTRGYVVFIQEADPTVRGSKRRLYFGPSQSKTPPGLRDVTFELEWGKSLIDFRPTLTTANQIRSVTVNGWSRKKRSTISATVNLKDRKLNRNRDLYDLLEKCDPREEVVVDEPVFTKTQARKRAIAILMDRQKEMVKAGGTTVGLPDLRAGKQIIIKGIGARFSGKYFVTETTHTINDSGYITKFKSRREDDGGGKRL
jgi:phage protein D